MITKSFGKLLGKKGMAHKMTVFNNCKNKLLKRKKKWQIKINSC